MTSSDLEPNHRERRDRDWLIRYVTQPIEGTPRNRRYLTLLNDRLDDTYLGLDLHWLAAGGDDSRSARGQTNVLGNLAFSYYTPGLRFHRDPIVLEKIRQGYLAVAAHITEEGKFIWPGEHEMYWAGSHEHAWRLEPLLIGYIWIGSFLPAADRAIIEAALDRAANWLFENPLTQTNNRGAVWCAVTTLCGLYYERPHYIERVEEHAETIIHTIVSEDGESGENTEQYGGGGPDSNYSYTGWSYIYLYRLLSGNSSLDARLLNSARWFACYNTLSGCPLVAGASVRQRYVNPANFQDMLPMFERFSHVEPFFALVTSHLISKLEDPARTPLHFSHQGSGHIVTPLIWSVLEHGIEPAAERYPDWYVNHTGMYDRPAVQYALVIRAYQTGITFRGLHSKHVDFPLRGLQSFAYHDEYPILLHTDSCNSSTRANGIDTATTNVTIGPRGPEVMFIPGARIEKWRANLATFIERREKLWTIYVFTPLTTLVAYGGVEGDIESRWIFNRTFVSEPTLDATKAVTTFTGRAGRIYWLNGRASLVPVPPGATDDFPSHTTLTMALEVVSPGPANAFAFSNDTFRFDSNDRAPESLSFIDASGRYTLALRDILDADSNIRPGNRGLMLA